ncbi:RNA-binding protein [Chitinophaga polysaccharea]|uniref:RNA recognition motif domain-containing protein n=1 Tax=Chitinophaga TaxID=79328 RepID=UPI001454E785|nr:MULTISPECIES: RNA-binding protein [Chitinophaga]NLR61035.1 RNA-binding protein [Chitinophaga polysaccharea]NLU96244.1 RNA-binding protein [Chitinophaga sp. Ak27]
MNIFIGNLSSQTTEQQLTTLFSPFGMVRSTKVIIDNYTGRSKGFGFVEMPVDAEAERAIRDLNSTLMDAQVIVVNEARPRTERERFPRPRY